MPSESSLRLKVWADVFKDFRQVTNVRPIDATETIEVRISGRETPLIAIRDNLDDMLSHCRGRAKEVVATFLKQNNIIVYFQDTLVGFFDIIGYSSFIKESPTIEECVKRVSRFFEILPTGKQGMASIGTGLWILSDSIIITIDTNRSNLYDGSLITFLSTCSLILSHAMKAKLPLRGAIGGGDFYKDGDVMVSSALIDAASYEKEQEWLGAVLTPKALHVIEKAKDYEKKRFGQTNIDLTSGKYSSYIRYGEIAWKEESSRLTRPRETYYIKPHAMAEVEWAERYLPSYFNAPLKVSKSHCLYGIE